MTKNTLRRLITITREATAAEIAEADAFRRVIARMHEAEDHPERFRFETKVTRR